VLRVPRRHVLRRCFHRRRRSLREKESKKKERKEERKEERK
jgi:hypothetical protein